MFKKTVISVGVALLAINLGHAQTAQQQLNSIQAQINQLNQQLTNQKYNSSTPIITSDSKLPMAGLSKVHFAEAVLVNKDIYQAPLVIGGHLEGDAQTWNGSYTYNSNGSFNQSGQSIAFTKLYLFTLANMNSWTTAVVTLKNNLPGNSIGFDRAFLNFGNLNKSPWYLTVGNAFLPFGSFSGNGPLDNSLTTNTFRVNPTTQAMLGLNTHGFDSNLGVYSDNTFSNNGLHDFLFDTTWTHSLNSSTQLSLGGGYLNDVRGTSSGIGSAYALTTPSAVSPLSAGKTGAYDLNANLTINRISLLGEFVSTTQSATANNQNIGKPTVWMLGTVYKQTLWNWPTQFQLSYSQTKNMQNIQLPASADYAENLKITGIKSEWLASITSQVWKNLYVGPEFDYNHLYAGTNTWTLTLDGTAYF